MVPTISSNVQYSSARLTPVYFQANCTRLASQPTGSLAWETASLSLPLPTLQAKFSGIIGYYQQYDKARCNHHDHDHDHDNVVSGDLAIQHPDVERHLRRKPYSSTQCGRTTLHIWGRKVTSLLFDFFFCVNFYQSFSGQILFSQAW